MSVYRPSYRDAKTGEWKEQDVYWYKFRFAGRLIRESSKSTRKTLAIQAEKNRRQELERGYNGIEDNRGERIRTVAELAHEFLDGYRLRNPKSATFAEYAVGHLTRLIGKSMSVEIGDAAVTGYQTVRLKEAASAKSINEEIGFLLRILGEQGDFIRAKLRRKKSLKLKVGRHTAKAFSVADKAACPASTISLDRVDSRLLLPARSGCLIKMLPVKVQHDGHQNREATQFGNQTRIDQGDRGAVSDRATNRKEEDSRRIH